MADFFSSLLDSRAFTAFSIFNPHYKPPKPIFTVPPSLNPTSRRSKLLSFPVLCIPISSTRSSPDFDLVSTSECGDGSFVFQFGDACEIERIRELEKQNSEANDLKVLEGEDEGEVTSNSSNEVANNESDCQLGLSETSLEVSKEGETSVSHVDDNVVDFQPESSERLVEVSKGGELQASVSDVNTIDPENAENVHDKEDSVEKDTDENRRSKIGSVSDRNIRSENYGDSGDVFKENSGNDSLTGSGSLAVSVIEVHPSDACEESSQAHVNEKTTGFEESVQVDSVETPPTPHESSPISTLEAERSEGIEFSGDLTKESGASAEDVKLTQTSVDGEEISMEILFLSSGAALLPHPSKALAGGEEGYFVTNLNWLGVADGVGQWSLEGTNPGVYARELMENCGKIVSNSSSLINPVEVLNRSVEEAQAPGSSTLLVAYFDGKVLRVANIGDSGFIIIRNGVVHMRSSPMHYEFHFPLRIGSGHNPSELVEEYKIDLEEGDIIVTATDGLLDNLYEEEIASIISLSLLANINPQEIAKLLARRAQEVGKSSSARSPFADAARAAGYIAYTGGKPDGVAVIVSLVQKISN